jgi:hypothetical protein
MPPVANRRHTASCVLASTLMAWHGAAQNDGRLAEVRARLHTTSGGASDTEASELMVTPTGFPSAPPAVTTVTPVANCPSASRNARCAGGVPPSASTVP